MKNSKWLLIPLLFLTNFAIGQNNEPEVTNVLKEDRKVDDISLLNSQYNLDEVGMNEVYIINHGKMEKVSTTTATAPKTPTHPSSTTSGNSSSVSGSNKKEDSKAGQLNAAKSSTKNKQTTRKTASSRKKSAKYKRIKLKKKRRPGKKKTKGCYRF